MKCLNIISIIAILSCLISQTAFTKEVNVYSYRKPQLIKPMFDMFTKKTGITVNTVYAQKGMLERLKNEGNNSPADLIFTVDIGRITNFKKAGLVQAIHSEALNANIPSNFRDPDGFWFGLTSRARVIVVSSERIKEGEISSYEELAQSKWKGRVCTRQGKHPYMAALTASVIAAHGSDQAKIWLTGLKNNLARRPQGNDRAQVKAIFSGICDIALINHYYLVRMLVDPEQKEPAESVRIVFPNQEDRGTHMNVSGVSMAKFSPNSKEALKLMEFLASPEGQRLYAEKNGEYPVNADVSPNPLVKSWGKFKHDTLGLERIGNLRESGVRLADEVGYND